MAKDEPDIPQCESRFRDPWGKIWQCELPWGHGVTSRDIRHSVRIPFDLFQSLGAPRISDRFHWTQLKEIKP